ncbi:hypothetical protein P154DRAFT_535939 [Amniculicola lignicola CBS 123094]|uniref:Uncharacterized protein n=1 Tax=Amniculicola lignicola CBS 123094 TaxID=1392246 RepID=A0A6A5WFA8_9PLEO|nr:hypothetical protein P154DRAFT_535939 [Amniculicola lignicola CBS 123094]
MSFTPKCHDVTMVHNILQTFRFPTELILEIIDHARYWPELCGSFEHKSILADEEWTTSYTQANLYKVFAVSSTLYHSKTKLKEIEFEIVSHDQGWTTEGTKGTYKTTSWFEVSVLRPKYKRRRNTRLAHTFEGRFFKHPEDAFDDIRKDGWDIVPRPSREREPQRLCYEGMETTSGVTEGEYTWWLQGNIVTKGMSIFDGEMVKRYRVVWGCHRNPVFEGNEGAGLGEGFVDSLQEGDNIAIWARAKRRGWENHVYGIRTRIRFSF